MKVPSLVRSGFLNLFGLASRKPGQDPRVEYQVTSVYVNLSAARGQACLPARLSAVLAQAGAPAGGPGTGRDGHLLVIGVSKLFQGSLAFIESRAAAVFFGLRIFRVNTPMKS